MRLAGWRLAVLMAGCAVALGALPVARAQAVTASAPVAASSDGCPPLVHMNLEEIAAQARALTRAGQPDRGVLWRLEKDGRTSYLFGTVHVARLEWDVPGRTLAQALGSSQRIAVEVDVTRQDRHVNVVKDALRPPGAEDAALAREVSRRFQALCVDDSKIVAGTRMKLMALQTLAALDAGLTPAFALDAVMIGYAKAAHKPLVELEELGEQFDALGSMFEADGSDRALLQAYDDGKVREGLVRVAEAWAASDVDAIAATGDAMQVSAESRAAYDKVILARNVTLAKRMDVFFRGEGQGLAAVGALHVVGKGSVVDALRAMGYEATLLVPQAAGGGK